MTSLLTLHEDHIGTQSQLWHIPAGGLLLEGELRLPANAGGLVVFAHATRHSTRNQALAEEFAEAGLGTLLLDLLTPEEQRRGSVTGVRRRDIELLARRLGGVVRWLERQPRMGEVKTGCIGAGLGAAAALVAAADLSNHIAAVVSRGGRPDLAGEALSKVRTPTLLIVGGNEEDLVLLNEDAFAEMRWRRDLKILPGTTHRFEEPGKLREVARLSANWFRQYLA